MIDIQHVRKEAFDLLTNHLSEKLTYHSKGHTKDVVKQALHIANCEGICDAQDLLILETAALFHDTGFTRVYKGHEAESCRIALQKLPESGASNAEIERIQEVIMATKIPQSPRNILEKILCDADLDYLGRHDYQQVAALLEQEWLTYNLLNTDNHFNDIQIHFLERHQYFTDYSIHHREPVKRLHLENLRKTAV